MKRLFLLSVLALAACNNAGQVPLAAIESVLAQPTPETRKAEIIRKVKAICPTPLSNDDLEFAAQFVEENRTKGAAWIAGRLWKMNAETRLCRGLK